MHELNVAPSWATCEFEVMPFIDRLCYDNFSIKLVNSPVDVPVYRETPSNCFRHRLRRSDVDDGVSYPTGKEQFRNLF